MIKNKQANRVKWHRPLRPWKKLFVKKEDQEKKKKNSKWLSCRVKQISNIFLFFPHEIKGVNKSDIFF